MKYIDADKLKAEIERLTEEDNNIKCKENENFCSGYDAAFYDLLSFINSLQQEQPKVDLDAEIEMQWDSFNKHVVKYDDESEDVVWLNWNSFVDVASYFYYLGKNNSK